MTAAVVVYNDVRALLWTVGGRKHTVSYLAPSGHSSSQLQHLKDAPVPTHRLK